MGSLIFRFPFARLSRASVLCRASSELECPKTTAMRWKPWASPRSREMLTARYHRCEYDVNMWTIVLPSSISFCPVCPFCPFCPCSFCFFLVLDALKMSKIWKKSTCIKDIYQHFKEFTAWTFEKVRNKKTTGSLVNSHCKICGQAEDP